MTRKLVPKRVAADGDAGADQRGEVGSMRRVDGGRHGDDDEIGIAQAGFVRGDLELARGAQILGAHFAGRIQVLTIGIDLRL